MKKLSYFQNRIKNRRAVSEILGYVLLIIIALGLSVLVFSYLKSFTPKDKPECKSDIHLVLVNYTCTKGNLILSMQNKGLFSIDAAYIRVGGESRKVKDLINKDNLYIQLNSSVKGLPPGQTITKQYIHPSITEEKLGLEIQPAVFDKNELAICSNAVITQEISCTERLTT